MRGWLNQSISRSKDLEFNPVLFPPYTALQIQISNINLYLKSCCHGKRLFNHDTQIRCPHKIPNLPGWFPAQGMIVKASRLGGLTITLPPPLQHPLGSHSSPGSHLGILLSSSFLRVLPIHPVANSKESASLNSERISTKVSLTINLGAFLTFLPTLSDLLPILSKAD